MNGTRLLDDRDPVAAALGFREVIAHTRDAMWQVDGLIHILATTSSLLSNFSKLAEDLEIFSSSEFDFVDLDDAYSRSSILMPQKRNPYSLAIIRGASGVIIGRLTGFLAVTKSPSARSDNLIFAYGEVPRALDLSQRITRLTGGVIRTLRVNPERMREELDRGYTQATDLAEHLVGLVGVDYRTAYVVVGNTVRQASRSGIPGHAITGAMLDEAAHGAHRAQLGARGRRSDGRPRSAVDRRVPAGRGRRRAGSAGRDDRNLRDVLVELRAAADQRTAGFAAAETALLARARASAAEPVRLTGQASGTSTATISAVVSPELRHRCSSHEGKCSASPAATT